MVNYLQVAITLVQYGFTAWFYFSGSCMAISGYLLFLAQRTIPMGTAYAVWTGIGAAGTFVVGIFLYGDPTGFARIFAVLLIISGVILLKLAH